MIGQGLIGDIAGALVGLGRALKGQELPGSQLDVLRVGPRKTVSGRIDLFGTPSAPAVVAASAAGAGTVTDEVNVEYSAGLGLWVAVFSDNTDGLAVGIEAGPDSTSFLPIALIGTYAVATAGPLRTAVAATDFPGTLQLNNEFTAPLYVTQWQIPANQDAGAANGLIVAIDVAKYAVVRFRLTCPSATAAWLGYTLTSQGG